MTRQNKYDQAVNFVPAVDPYELPDQQHDVIHPPPLPTQIQSSMMPDIIAKNVGNSPRYREGRPQDYALATGLRFAFLLLVVAMVNAPIVFFALRVTPYGAGEGIPAWLLLSGLMGVGAWLKMDASDKAHSPAGAERHRADKAAQTAITINKDQVEAWRDVEKTRWSRHYDSIENQQRIDATERQQLLDERRRLNG